MRSGKAGEKKTSNDLGFTTLRLFCEHCKLAKNTQYWEAKELVLFFERKKTRVCHMTAYIEKSSVLCEQVNYFVSFWNTAFQ